MNKGIRKDLESKSKDELIEVIDKYQRIMSCIEETLVDQSKWHIDTETAIKKIREYACQENSIL